MLRDEDFMKMALEEAKLAAAAGDVPVGALVVREGEVVSRAHNEREVSGRATAHAEVLALERASAALGRWRLSDCTLYVTLEPCPMCAGAVLNARVGRVCFAAKDAQAGAFGSVINLNAYPLPFRVPVDRGPLADESAALLRGFFEKRRKPKEP